MTPYTFIFVGRSGAGKGTQFELLQRYVAETRPNEAMYTFVMGDQFRAFMKQDSYASARAKDIINQGKLMPDFITVSFFADALLHNLGAEKHLFIDGIPRSPVQAEAVMDAMMYYNRTNPIVIDVSVTAEEVSRRMLARGRADDTPAAIEERLSYYDAHVVPAVEILKTMPGVTYFEIDGNRSIEAIHQDIISRISTIA